MPENTYFDIRVDPRYLPWDDFVARYIDPIVENNPKACIKLLFSEDRRLLQLSGYDMEIPDASSI